MRKILLTLILVLIFITQCSGPVALRGKFEPPVAPPYKGEIVGRYKVSAIPVSAPMIPDSIHSVWLDADGKILVFNHESNKEEKRIDGKEKITGFCYQDSQLVWVEESGKNSVVGYDLRNSDEMWRTHGLPSATNPVLYKENALLVSVGGSVFADSAVNGHEKWNLKTKGRVFANPIIWNGQLVVGSAQGTVTGIDCEKGTSKWRLNLNEPIMTLCANDSTIFIGTQTGDMIAVNARTQKVLWKVSTGNQIVHHPLALGDSLLWTNSKGEIYKIDTSTGDYQLLVTLNIPFAGTPVKSDKGILLSGLDGNLYLLNPETGTVQKSLKFDGRLRSAPIFIQNHWYLAVEDHWIYEVR